MEENPIPASITTIQNANWLGCIPIILSLAPSSLSSPVAPRPLHKMVARVTYLHVGLSEEVIQLSKCAPAGGLSRKGVVMTEEPSENDDPPTDAVKDEDGSNKIGQVSNETKMDKEEETKYTPKEENQTVVETKTSIPSQNDFPICWFEDELSGEPLRWHLFVGVLHDATKGKAAVQNLSRMGSNAKEPNLLPWRIRLHFTSYPTKLLPFEKISIQSTTCSQGDDSVNDSCRDINHTNQVSSSIGRIFRNSLKQALFMQYSSAKVAMSISKSSHEKIWNAILSTDYISYREVNNSLQMGISSEAIVLPAAAEISSNVPELVPIRIMLNSESVMQKPCRAFRDINESTKRTKEDHTAEEEPTEDDQVLENLVERLESCSIRPKTSLGDVLLSWLPQHFERDEINEVVAKPSVHYSLQGIQPKLTSPILDLWKCLCHPDHFLYITVIA